MYESDDEQSKREFYYHESNNKNNKNNNIENDDFMLCYIYVCKIQYMYVLLTSTAWSLRENIRPQSFMYRPRATGSGPYRQDLGRIFSRNDRTLG